MIIFHETAASIEKQRLTALDRLPMHCRTCCVCGETEPTLIQVHHIGKPRFRRLNLHNSFTLGLCVRCHTPITIRQRWRKRHSLIHASEAEHLAYSLCDLADLIEVSVETNGGRGSDWHTIADFRIQAAALLKASPTDRTTLLTRARLQIHYYAWWLVRNANRLRVFLAGPAPRVWWSDEFWGSVLTFTVEPEEVESIEQEELEDG